jgi:hypothetical protein
MHIPDLSHVRKVLTDEQSEAARVAALKAGDKRYRRVLARTNDEDAAECERISIWFRVWLHHMKRYGQSRDN